MALHHRVPFFEWTVVRVCVDGEERVVYSGDELLARRVLLRTEIDGGGLELRDPKGRVRQIRSSLRSEAAE